MRHRWLLVWALALAACGGSSRSVGSDDNGDDGGGDRGGSSAGGRGGSSGASGMGTSGSVGSAGEGASPGAGGSVGGAAGTTARGGSSSGSGGANASGGSAGMSAMPPITSCTDEFPFAGEWEGHILDFFYEPLEELGLSVRDAAGGAGGFVGTLVWGEGDPPPPPTSADEPYPPGLNLGGMAGSTSYAPWPGYPYSVVRGAGCDASFRVSISVAEVWSEWCALQDPVYTEGQGWGCTYRGGGSSDGVTCQVQDGRGGVVAEYPQWRCDLCGWVGPSVCVCDESSCAFNPEATHTLDLTLNQAGDVLSGPDSSCGDCTVRLERAD